MQLLEKVFKKALLIIFYSLWCNESVTNYSEHWNLIINTQFISFSLSSELCGFTVVGLCVWLIVYIYQRQEENIDI